MGDSDGVVKGKKIFEVVGGSRMGIIIRPKDAKYGDYPPVDDFNADEDEIWKNYYYLFISILMLIFCQNFNSLINSQ